MASGPFYGYNHSGVDPSEPVIQNRWRPAPVGAASAEHDEITACCGDDQVVNPATTAPVTAKLVASGTLRLTPGTSIRWVYRLNSERYVRMDVFMIICRLLEGKNSGQWQRRSSPSKRA